MSRLNVAPAPRPPLSGCCNFHWTSGRSFLPTTTKKSFPRQFPANKSTITTTSLLKQQPPGRVKLQTTIHSCIYHLWFSLLPLLYFSSLSRCPCAGSNREDLARPGKHWRGMYSLVLQGAAPSTRISPGHLSALSQPFMNRHFLYWAFGSLCGCGANEAAATKLPILISLKDFTCCSLPSVLPSLGPSSSFLFNPHCPGSLLLLILQTLY